MLKIARAVGLGVLILVMTASVTSAQDGNVGYDPTKKLVELVTVTADEDGVATADVTLPEDVTEGYEVLAEGLDPLGEFRRTFAEVVDDEMAMSVGGETISIQLASTTGAIDRTITVTASGFAPFAEVTFFVRYVPDRAPGSDGGDGASDGERGGGLPRTGSDATFAAAIGVGAVVLGLGVLMARRERRAQT